jgi:exodeoxyribonuclease VII large subunit
MLRPLDMGRQPVTYSVADLNREARALLEAAYGDVCVEGEVVDVTLAKSGHLYFALADPGGKAQIDAVMWRGQAMRYKACIAKGKAVRCRGRVTLYEAGGRYQFVAESAQEAGAGVKARLLAELRARLDAEGLFAPERKRPLPGFPRCVGVVTSRSGAAIRDVVTVASRRFPARILLAHAQVQGAGAAEEIARGVALLCAHPLVDVVIVGRGGGSSDDLDAFNAEVAVRAIAACRVPVISAVGHETDVTLADLAADRRAATPSEAAELAVPELARLVGRLSELRRGMRLGLGRRLARDRVRVGALGARLKSRDPRALLHRDKVRLARAEEALRGWPGVRIAAARAALAKEVARLDALSPLAVLTRGYAVVRRSADGAVVRAPADAPAGTPIDLTLASGRLTAEVTTSSSSKETT